MTGDYLYCGEEKYINLTEICNRRPGLGGMIAWKWILKKWDEKSWIDLFD
jgi:hypothetical protein